MSILKPIINKNELEAKEQLEFYGFWLWNYERANKTEDVIEFKQKCTEEEFKLRNDGVDIRYKCYKRECRHCSFNAKYLRNRLIDYIYKKHTTDNFFDIRVLQRFSSEEILNNVYKSNLDEKVKIDYSKGYLLNKTIVGQDELNLIVSDALKFVFKKDHQTVSINFFLPEEIIVIHAVLLKKAVEFIINNIGIHFDMRQHGDYYSNDVSAHLFDYLNKNNVHFTSLLASLKSSPDISFNLNHNRRSLGFWLWENIIFLKKYKSVKEAIYFFQSGTQYPNNILNILGFATTQDIDDILRICRRFLQRTKDCIAHAEVLSFR